MHREKGKEPLREAVKRLDKRLWHQLEEVWRLAEEGIQDAQKSMDGHQQGAPHCRAVEENLAALIPDDWRGTRFTVTDIFVLSAAAALHDVGKAGDSPEDHGHISMWEIRDRPAAYGLDQGQAIAVGWVVRAHNDGDLEALPHGPVSLGATEVDVRPLAALFKLADALHTDYRRVSRQVVEFGGKQGEDNPKTHFRMLVTGWRFDGRGRIELYAVPKDWDHVPVIQTGFEMTRRELEPIVPTLRVADLPWELTLCVDETELERRAILEVEAEHRIERAFVGMDYFTEADASRFKGREDDAQALWRRMMAVPLTLLVGDSGVGKTSLIHAGLFPLVHKARWCTAYTRPFDDPDRFIVRDLWRDLRDVVEREPPIDTTITDALAQASKAVGGRKLLVVLDQFEDVVRIPLPEMLDGVLRALVAVQAERFRNLRLLVSYRADAEAALGPFFQEVSGSNHGPSRTYLRPLSRAGARAALEAGFAQAQVGMSDPLLLDTIAAELEIQTPTTGAYPPYVQMVGETLCRATRVEKDSILDEELYRTRGGCGGIIGRYLLRRLAELGERQEAAHLVLVALVRSTGTKGQQSSEELQAETRLAMEELTPLLAELVDKRMIRHLGGGQYEIIHDYLARLVDEVIVGPEERQLKELRELLDLKARAYERKHVPLTSPDIARLYTKRERISPNGEQIQLLLHSSLLGRGPAWFWLQDACEDQYLPLLRDALVSPIAALRQNAVPIVAQVAGQEAIPDLRLMLEDENAKVRLAAMEVLVQVMGREAIPDLRRMLSVRERSVRETAGRTLIKILRPVGQEDVADLRLMLKWQSQEVQCAALEMLVQVVGQEALPDLREALRYQKGSVREAARQALLQLVQQAEREVIPYLKEMLRDRNRYVRQAAIEAFVKVARQQDVPALLKMLRDPARRVREAAKAALGEVAGREAIPDLRDMLDDAETRGAAAMILAQVAGREAIPDLRERLREMLKDADLGDQRAAGDALCCAIQQMGCEDIPYLQELMNDESWSVRSAVAQALPKALQQVGREAIPDLLALLRHETHDPRPGGRALAAKTREAASQALVQVFLQMGSEAIPELLTMLEDQNKDIRRAAERALDQVLQQQTGREVIPDLREMLKDQRAYVRKVATGALGRVAEREAMPDLRRMLKDPQPAVRRTAVTALAQLGAQESIPNLLEMLKDQHRGVRATTAHRLAQLAAREAIPDLREMLKDKEETVRYHAARTLVRVLEHADREDIPELHALLWVRSGHVRSAAAQALARVAGWEAIPELRKLLSVNILCVWQGARSALAHAFQQAEREAIPDLRKMLRDPNPQIRMLAAGALARVAGREAILDLRKLLLDVDYRVRQTAEQALKELIMEDDLTWLAESAASYPVAETGGREAASRLLIHLDRKLYCPFEWPEC